MKHSEECFITYPNISKCIKKTRLRLVFSTYFSVFGYVIKHSSSCFIYYIQDQLKEGAVPTNQEFYFPHKPCGERDGREYENENCV